jgi:hypothetical protein
MSNVKVTQPVRLLAMCCNDAVNAWLHVDRCLQRGGCARSLRAWGSQPVAAAAAARRQHQAQQQQRQQ